MAARLSCLVVFLIIAYFDNVIGEDTPKTIGEILKIPDIFGKLSNVNETENDAIAQVKQLLNENEQTNPNITEVKSKSEADGYKRPTRNAGFGLQKPIPGNIPRFSPRLQPMYQRYPLPYRGLNRFGQRRFGPGQWNQGGFVRPGPYPFRPGFGPMNQNPGFWGGVPQRPVFNPMQFGVPRYPQGPPVPMGGQNSFGNQNFNRFNQDQDGIDVNVDLSLPEWDQESVGLILANVSETDQGTITAQIAMVVFPDDDNAPDQLQNEGPRPRL